MKADTSKFFYLKDHLGSTRAVINTQNQVISAQDYDPWGYIIENRSYQSENSKYKFTGKERDRDIESNYDYFGARYYDSRIGRWGQVEPLLDIYLSFSPYIYIFDNPTNIVDIDGRGPGGGSIKAEPYPYDGGGWGYVGTGIGIGGAAEIVQAIQAISSAIINLIDEWIDNFWEQKVTNENTSEGEHKKEDIIGSTGVQTPSKTIWKDKQGKGRIDVENVSPGKQKGDIHFQDPKKYPGKKYRYNPEEQKFYDKDTGEKAPNKVQDILKRKDVQDAIKKGLEKYLGE